MAIGTPILFATLDSGAGTADPVFTVPAGVTTSTWIAVAANFITGTTITCTYSTTSAAGTLQQRGSTTEGTSAMAFIFEGKGFLPGDQITLSPNVANRSVGIGIAYPGADYDQIGTAGASSTAQANSPGITTPSANNVAVAFSFGIASATGRTFSSLTAGWAQQTFKQGGSGTRFQMSQISDKTIAAAGASGALVATASGTLLGSGGFQIGIKPSATTQNASAAGTVTAGGGPGATLTEQAAATGQVTATGTPSPILAEAAAATGQVTATSTVGAPTQTEAAAATGTVTATGTAAAPNQTEAAAATGQVTAQGNPPAQLTEQANATGQVTAGGGPPAVITEQANAAGTVTAQGTATGQVLLPAAAAGTVTAQGGPSAQLDEHAAASGTVTATGNPPAQLDEHAAATGQVTAQGTADASPPSGSASAEVTALGTVGAPIIGVAAAAAGQVTATGGASAGQTLAAAASGEVTADGTASANPPAKQGSAAGEVTALGTAIPPSMILPGTAAGFVYAIADLGAPVRTVPASALGQVRAAGGADAVAFLYAAAAGTVTAEGTADAHTFAPLNVWIVRSELEPGPWRATLASWLANLDRPPWEAIADGWFAQLETGGRWVAVQEDDVSRTIRATMGDYGYASALVTFADDDPETPVNLDDVTWTAALVPEGTEPTADLFAPTTDVTAVPDQPLQRRVRVLVGAGQAVNPPPGDYVLAVRPDAPPTLEVVLCENDTVEII